MDIFKCFIDMQYKYFDLNFIIFTMDSTKTISTPHRRLVNNDPVNWRTYALQDSSEFRQSDTCINTSLSYLP